jgi:hypothetical protein
VTGCLTFNFLYMTISAKRDQVTACKGDVCLTVVGDLAKALTVVLIICVAVSTVGQLIKVLK